MELPTAAGLAFLVFILNRLPKKRKTNLCISTWRNDSTPTHLYTTKGGEGVAMNPRCIAVCRWRSLLASHHLPLPFPWTLSLRRQQCPCDCPCLFTRTSTDTKTEKNKMRGMSFFEHTSTHKDWHTQASHSNGMGMGPITESDPRDQEGKTSEWGSLHCWYSCAPASFAHTTQQPGGWGAFDWEASDATQYLQQSWSRGGTWQQKISDWPQLHIGGYPATDTSRCTPSTSESVHGPLDKCANKR